MLIKLKKKKETKRKKAFIPSLQHSKHLSRSEHPPSAQSADGIFDRGNETQFKQGISL